MRKHFNSTIVFIILITAVLFLCEGCGKNLLHSGNKKIRGASPLTAESRIGEYVLTIPEGKEDHISEISCSLLMKHPTLKDYYVLLSTIPCQVSDEDGKIHISKSQKVPSVYDNIGEEFMPLANVEYQKASDTYSLQAYLFDVEADYADVMSDGFVSCNFTLSPSGEDSLSYHLEPVSMAGICPEIFDHLKKEGRVICTVPYYSKVLRGYDGEFRPYDEWSLSSENITRFFAFETEAGKFIEDGLRFTLVDIQEMSQPVSAMISIKYTDGQSLQSDLLTLKQSRENEQKKTVKTEKGKLTFLIRDGKACLTDYIGKDDTLTIPEKVENYPVTKVDNYAIYSDQLTRITFPEGLITLQGAAVYYCPALTTVSLPSSLQNFPSISFWNCENLEKITFAGDNPYYQIRNNLILSSDGKTVVFAPKPWRDIAEFPME